MENPHNENTDIKNWYIPARSSNPTAYTQKTPVYTAKNGVAVDSSQPQKSDPARQPLTVDNMKEGDAYKNTYYNPDVKPNPKEYVSEKNIVAEQLKEAEQFEKSSKEGNSTQATNVTKKAD